MGAGYSFVTLDDDQKHLRRQLLDRYGFAAQLSALIPLLAIQLYFFCEWFLRRVRQSSRLNVPSSPILKSLQLEDNQRIKNAATRLRRLMWWCGDETLIAGLNLGTRGEVLFVALWAVWLVALSVLQTGDDYLHLTKRFGIVAASQLPFHYLLAIKTPYSPLQLLTHASHETLNILHQLLGRVITLLIYLHVALYLNFYVQVGVLKIRLQEAYVICGLTAAILFTLLNTSSLPAIRRASYRVFLAVHILFSLAVLPLLFFHVHHIRIYVYETIAVLVLNVLLRALATRTYTNAKITLIPGTQLVNIVIPLDTKATTWMPGQHAYLSLPGQALKAAIAKNPFTLSSVPASDHRLRFIARIQNGNTSALAKAASSGKSTQQVLIEGPYGVTTHADRLLAYDRVLLIAGGIGSTFIIPLYRQLLTDLSPTAGSYRRQKVNTVWVARSQAETTWALPTDVAEKEGFFERLRVFITRSDDGGLAQSGDAAESYARRDESVAGEEGIELEERAELLSKQEGASVAHTGLPMVAGRPDITRIVDQAFSGSAKERIAVVVCGPHGLGRAVRQQVGTWVQKGRSVWFWNESFAL